MPLIFAFAVNRDGVFEKKHSGDSEKFIIYQYNNDQFEFLEEIENPLKKEEKYSQHGSQEKVDAIIRFLKNKNVNILISKQFGKNIKLVNTHFIPVIVEEGLPDKVISILQKNIFWLSDELNNRKSGYMLFRLKNGILKMHVGRNNPSDGKSIKLH